ncbi:hypothetical protein ONS95_008496 [Cadophora gregata]|uniref:uncharacterized protein n=1 Tax=Cadophora gregata TaxID=51156 RepID=UPI0026DC6241|nr:uncharacterized protein ONS95_008496 [Cadophora gregata]KAK0100157.1 hypothetical protein ONS95_008496 [Cadophora gregata]
MRNKRVGFLGDPNFPTYGLKGTKGGDITFYESLYEDYSRKSFTHIEDRPFAISGLEQRLHQALDEKIGSGGGFWGIFDHYWGRGLLWQREANVERMIRLRRGASGREAAPSWSWEGHSGGITFMKPDPHTVDWLSDEVILPWTKAKESHSRMTTASYRGERALKGKALEWKHDPHLNHDDTYESIVYDDEANLPSRDILRILVVGRKKLTEYQHSQVRKHSYVLVLAPKGVASGYIYERVGAGSLDESLIDFENSTSVLVE